MPYNPDRNAVVESRAMTTSASKPAFDSTSGSPGAVRFFNPGPVWCRPQVMQALTGQDITVYGDGRQTRSFCHVDDLVDGLIRLMESEDRVTGPINLGNPGEFTILELAQKVIARTNSRSKIVHAPLPADDPVQRQPDITKARDLLGWAPTIPLDEGLGRTIAWFERLVRGKDA